MSTKNSKGNVSEKPVLISDTTLRDSHQSSFATRMRIEDMLEVAKEMNRVGFYSMEVWGGATFDVATRFLNEDPWERCKTLRKHMPDVKLTMLLRGQNLVGYRHYADDVAEAFIDEAADVGVDIFRVFDALNDERNFITAFKAIKRNRRHIQAAISYSLTERRLGGPIYNIPYYVNKAKILADMGADSICIKDMAGILSPYDAYDLVSALKAEMELPIQLHTHYTSGMASMTLLKAIEAGVDIVDTCLAPFALRSSQPAIEPIVASLLNTSRDTGLDLERLFRIGEKLETIAPKYRQYLDTSRMAVIDTAVLMHQIPGGMTTNLVSQLKEANALDKLRDVFEELPRTRKDLGYPPLVTPTSQIVGIQSVQNVLFGRYKIISTQVKDYVYGLYGKPPAPIDPEVQRKVLAGYDKGETPITCRAADIIEPELEKAKKATKGLAKDMKDVLTYALYPITGMKFLKWKYGLEEPPPEVKPLTIDEVKKQNELVEKALKGLLVEKPDKDAPDKGPGLRTFNVFVDEDHYKVEVEEVGGIPSVTSVSRMAPPPEPVVEKPKPAPAPKPAAPAPKAKKTPGVELKEGETAVQSPMPGLLIKYEKKVGDEVHEEENVVTIEAMKMQMAITAPVSGVIRAINFKSGDSVEKNAVLAVIG
ncbi:MAG: pyruvate carboxylase subunit B [Candidatus Eremiobacteraeota bacterium]|nr:pyruvate carboxylase subunit B [Candidatus Eremiobacteraeota bacterium]